jgi:hypothetical protein
MSLLHPHPGATRHPTPSEFKGGQKTCSQGTFHILMRSAPPLLLWERGLGGEGEERIPTRIIRFQLTWAARP